MNIYIIIIALIITIALLTVFFKDHIILKYNASNVIKLADEASHDGGASFTKLGVNAIIRVISPLLRKFVPNDINEQRERYLHIFTKIKERNIASDIDSLLKLLPILPIPVDNLIEKLTDGIINSVSNDQVNPSKLLSTISNIIIDSLNISLALHPIDTINKIKRFLTNISVKSFNPEVIIFQAIAKSIVDQTNEGLSTLVNIINKFDDDLLSSFNIDLKQKDRILSIIKFIQSEEVMALIKDGIDGKLLLDKAKEFGIDNTDDISNIIKLMKKI
jgi:hypothetical protein